MKRVSATVALTGLLAALALALSFLEGLLPPLPFLPPGAKLGLSNIVTMYAAGTLGLPCAIFLALLKGGFALLTRGAVAGCMSGALAHNAAQLCVAYAITATPVVVYLPFLLVFGVLSGLLTGLVLKLTLPPLSKLRKYLGL